MIQALSSLTLTNPPINLGGTTAQCFQSGQSILFASMQGTVNATVKLYLWDPEQASWFLFPVTPVTLDTGVEGGRFLQRYVLGEGIQGTYCVFVTSAGTVNVSIRLTKD